MHKSWLLIPLSFTLVASPAEAFRFISNPDTQVTPPQKEKASRSKKKQSKEKKAPTLLEKVEEIVKEEIIPSPLAIDEAGKEVPIQDLSQDVELKNVEVKALQYREASALFPCPRDKKQEIIPLIQLEAAGNHEIIPELKSVHLIGSCSVFKAEIRQLKKLKRLIGQVPPPVEIDNLNLPKSDATRRKLEDAIGSYIGKPLTVKSLKKMQDDILDIYLKDGRFVVSTVVPEQSLKDGELDIIVTEAKVGKVVLRGHEKHFKDEHIQRYITSKPGDTINTDEVGKSLQLIDRNPFRQTDVVFVPSDEYGFSDLEYITRSRRTWRPYIGADNTGFPVTGYNRLFAGINFGNAFNADQQLDYQYTMSTDPHKFQAHTVNWVIPLQWKHFLNFFGGYSKVHIHDTKFNRKDTGRNAQASTRYTIPLHTPLDILQEMTFGFDWKRTNNDVEFSNIPLIRSAVNEAIFTAAYNVGLEKHTHKISFTTELFWSPGEMMGEMSKHDYEMLRPGASSHFGYIRAAFLHQITLPQEWELRYKIRGQAATDPLLPIEQFGLGGYDTVRGYLEREVNSDYALLTNLEFRTPRVSLLKLFGMDRPGDRAQLLLFWDYGYGANRGSGEFLPKHSWLTSVGPGFRYHIHENFTFRGDFGIQLHKTGLNHRFDTRFHWGLVASY